LNNLKVKGIAVRLIFKKSLLAQGLQTCAYVLLILKVLLLLFFVIATKKVTKEKSRQTRSLRAFCLASATHFNLKLNPLRSLPLCGLCVKFQSSINADFSFYYPHSVIFNRTAMVLTFDF
jgi:Na+/melibiose symporter-like transporter